MKQLAEKKRQSNIGEYIIYMYQMEDLVRSYHMNIGDIQKYVVSHYPISEEEKKEVGDWFQSLIHQMEEEDITEKGHLSTTQKEVGLLAEIHWKLLKSDKDYFEIYNKAKPHVIAAIMTAEGQYLGHEIQICLNGVYGLLLCRLTGKKTSPEQEKTAQAFGDVLSYLNWVYMEKQSQ